MGVEFTIVKELSTISATAAELAAVNAIICAEIESGEFRDEYDSLLSDILNTYRVVLATLKPLAAIHTVEAFAQQFPEQLQHYGDHYQSALSEPRINAEFTYEKYLQFRKRKELKTSYPPLKRSFARLHDFIDKWIDNDIWLAMCIDTLFKMLFRLLNEVQEFKSRDLEHAFATYHSCLGNVADLLNLIDTALAKVESEITTEVDSSVRAAG